MSKVRKNAPAPELTLEEIAERAAAIREEWDEETHRKRHWRTRNEEAVGVREYRDVVFE